MERRHVDGPAAGRARSIYELHLGTFTPEGTLDAALGRLDHLRSIGVDLVELMPVNSFNGTHNWGYDGVDWFAVDETYGGPEAYQRFVDGCHAAGLGVIQDVVYNHLGPSGNYLPLFGPYLKQGRNTWGDLVNLDGEGCAEVRRYILDNALMWFRDFHVDGLRLDAVHALHDESPTHLLEEMAIEVAALSAHLGRPLTLIAESDLNDPRLVTPREAGGYGLDAQWSDDFHHAVHVALTRETTGYYADFEPLGALAKVIEKGFFHDGTFSSFRERDHGVPIDTAAMPTWRLVVCSQNHDQIGNRAVGDRITEVARRRPARLRGAADPGRPVHADAVPGRGVGGAHAVPVLHLPPRARARQGHGRGPDRGVRADGLGPRRRARPAGPGDVHAVQARLVRARRAARGADAGGLPRPGPAAPRAARARPTRRSSATTCTVDEDGPAAHAAPRRPRRAGQLRRRRGGRPRSGRPSCCSRPRRASSSPATAIRLPGARRRPAASLPSTGCAVDRSTAERARSPTRRPRL